MKTFALVISFLLLTMGTASALAADGEISPKALPPDEALARPKATINLSLRVPQVEKAVDKITLYPYTTKPPRVMIPIKDLPTSAYAMKNMLLSTGYQSRLSLKKPYPEYGWRWQYAYRNALKHSGQTPPKTIVGIYSFTDAVTPYALKECKRINEIETARAERYTKAVQEYEDNHKDEEMEALRLGLEATPALLKPRLKGGVPISFDAQVTVPPGEWWVTGTHKVPGLVYYWQEPLKIDGNNTYNVELNDSNALLIQGGW